MVVVPTRFERQHPIRSVWGFGQRHRTVSSQAHPGVFRGNGRHRGASRVSEASLAKAGSKSSRWCDSGRSLSRSSRRRL